MQFLIVPEKLRMCCQIKHYTIREEVYKKGVGFMANEIMKGKIHQVKGKVKEEAGKITDNKTQEIKGKVENAAGKVQEQYGKTKRDIKKAIKD
jgi:uncharacterized protein YjbJ (UPF0337 family)